MATLHVIKGYNQGAKFSLKGDKILLGRNADCHVVINVPAVSREHAMILPEGGKFYLQDLGSRNRTYLNDDPNPVEGRALLRHKDRIRICDNVYEFHEQGERLPLPEEMRPDQAEADADVEAEEESATATVEATLSQGSSKQILEAQPAERLAFLLDVTTDLTKTFGFEQILPKIVDSLFRVFKQADRCFVIFAEEGTRRLVPRITKTSRGGDETPRFSKTIVRNCMDTGQAFLTADATSDSRVNLAQSIADYRIRSVMCAPLNGHRSGKTFGVIQLDTQDRGKKFGEDDLKLLMAVASQAAIALENANFHSSLLEQERIERDLQLAHRVQLSFLPKSPPQREGYHFAAHYEAAMKVGGDYYDFVPMPDRRIATMIGDVAGKGVPAALLMAKVSSDARFAVLTEPTPSNAVARLNDFLQEAAELSRFVTFQAAVVDPLNHQVTFVNAGHNPALLYRHRGGTVEEAFSRDWGGLPLGIAEGGEYDAYVVSLEPGDAVLLYSDGVTEAMNSADEEFGVERVYAALKGGPMTAPAMVERLIKAVKQFAQGRKQHDDITAVAFSRQA